MILIQSGTNPLNDGIRDYNQDPLTVGITDFSLGPKNQRSAAAGSGWY